MSILTATASLYKTALLHTLRGFPRTLLSLGVLVGGVAVVTAADELFFDPLGAGMLSSIGRALLQDVFVGTYLSLIGMWVLASRGTLVRHLRLHAGNLFMPLLTVVFVFWIVRLLLGLTGVPHTWALVVLVGLAVNPLPEVLYQDRLVSTDAFGQAFQFISRNWPEWLLAQLPWVALLAVWQVVFDRGPNAPVIGRLWMELGPELQPLSIPAQLSWPLDAPIRIAAGLLLLVAFHAMMLFRGTLYRELTKGSRRLREWQSRM